MFKILLHNDKKVFCSFRFVEEHQSTSKKELLDEVGVSVLRGG